MGFRFSNSRRQWGVGSKPHSESFGGFLKKGCLLIICIHLILQGCSSLKPVVVWDVWGPTPKSSRDEALVTWAAYKGMGKGYLVYGPTKSDDHVELWIDEGEGPEPVGFSVISLSGRKSRIEPVMGQEPAPSIGAFAFFSPLMNIYNWSTALLKKGWDHSQQALRHGYGRLVDFANQVMGR